MLGVRVCIRIDSDCFDTQSGTCSSYSAGDFATVGDEDFFKHGLFLKGVFLSFFSGSQDQIIIAKPATQLAPNCFEVFHQNNQ